MKTALAFALIPLSLAVLYAPVILGQVLPWGFEWPCWWYPLGEFARTSFARNGVVPFWIPGIFCGIPFAESLGPSVYYPTDMACWALGIPATVLYPADLLLHLLLAGAGAFALARFLGAGRSASAVGGVAFMLGGILAAEARTGILVFVRCSALLPFAFLAALRYAQGGGWRNIAMLASLLALMSLSAGHQAAFQTVIVLVIAGAFLPSGQRSRGITGIAGGTVIALALAAVTILPASRYFPLSLRSSGANTSFASVTPLFSGDIPLLVFPAWNGPPNLSQVKYLGLSVVALAFIGIAFCGRKALLWSAILGAALVLALGTQTPLGSALSHLPVISAFRVPLSWMNAGGLALAMLAALGASILNRAGWLRALAVLLPLTVATDLLRWDIRSAITAPRCARPLMDQVGNLLMAGTGVFRVESLEPSPILNSRIPRGLSFATGYHAAPSAAFTSLYVSAFSSGRLPALLPWLGVNRIVSSSPETQAPGWKPIGSAAGRDPVFQVPGQWWLFSDSDALPRAWLAEKSVCVLGPESIAEIMSKRPGRAKTVVLERNITLPLSSGSAKIITDSPNKVIVEARARGPGLLVLLDSFYPAWEARIDGRREMILRANGIFRAVKVPAGTHLVEFRWNSVFFNLGLWISFLSWSFLFCILFRKKPA